MLKYLVFRYPRLIVDFVNVEIFGFQLVKKKLERW